jgi:hypothetical protein
MGHADRVDNLGNSQMIYAESGEAMGLNLMGGGRSSSRRRRVLPVAHSPGCDRMAGIWLI